MTNEFEPIPGVESFGTEFTEEMGQLFDREHRLPPPPRPLNDLENSILDNLAKNRPDFTTRIYDSRQDYRPRPEPTLDERIQNSEVLSDCVKSMERYRSKNSRSRLNFGTEFHIAVHFRFDNTKYAFPPDIPDIEVGMANRTNLYQYLQHKGMILVDDTGRDAHQGTQTTQNNGYLMLPQEISHSDYFEFEDEVRKHYPFNKNEIELVRLLQQKAGQEPSPTEDFASDPRKMMELIDRLSMDERFISLFDVARKIKQARTDKPRATMDDEVATVPRVAERLGGDRLFSADIIMPIHTKSSLYDFDTTGLGDKKILLDDIDFEKLRQSFKKLDIFKQKLEDEI
jgi:hypothetical protein